MNKDISVENVLQDVHEAENAVIQAQSYSSPQYLQNANQKLMYASQHLNKIQNYISAYEEDHHNQLHRAKEQLRNLQETQNSLQ
jgi:hypothetical protein